MHSDAATAADTDWRQILQLYDQLLGVAPTPVVALNRAVAVAEVDGPEPALAIVDTLDLDGYHLLHATRADLLVRLGRAAGGLGRLPTCARPHDQCRRAEVPRGPDPSGRDDRPPRAPRHRSPSDVTIRGRGRANSL